MSRRLPRHLRRPGRSVDDARSNRSVPRDVARTTAKARMGLGTRGGPHTCAGVNCPRCAHECPRDAAVGKSSAAAGVRWQLNSLRRDASRGHRTARPWPRLWKGLPSGGPRRGAWRRRSRTRPCAVDGARAAASGGAATGSSVGRSSHRREGWGESASEPVPLPSAGRCEAEPFYPAGR